MKTTLHDVKLQLEQLESLLLEEENNKQYLIDKAHPQQRHAARNLIHYTRLRSEDIRELQISLHNLGLSSLASSESHILRQIRAVLDRLRNTEQEVVYNRRINSELLFESKKLFGSKKDALPHIMVTFDICFASDIDYLKQLLNYGMTIARINCAHDNQQVWEEMIANLKIACKETEKDCKVYMDLAGPKIRTEILGKGQKKGKVKITEGSIFYLTEKEADYDPKDIVIGCTIPGLISQLKEGEIVLFDDGALKAVIKSISNKTATLELLRNSKRSLNLKAEKGINFPESTLMISSLTEYDKQCLPFICENADQVGFSFIKTVADLKELQELFSYYDRKPKIILKIETPSAVKQLPALLLQGMAEDTFGVMIARGDLAVEVGFERLSEVQDEILWFCEAGHVPVIWATQVLESLHKTGIATRSEMTDAAHATMAECIMINKGEFTLKVLQTLTDVLKRNLGHRSKKTYSMRPLSIAEEFVKNNNLILE